LQNKFDSPKGRLPYTDEKIGEFLPFDSVSIPSGVFGGCAGVLGKMPDNNDLPQWKGYVEVIIHPGDHSGSHWLPISTLAPISQSGR